MRTTTPPGEHTWPAPALYISVSPNIHDIECAPKEPRGKDTKLTMEEIGLFLHSPRSRQTK